jgi:initiation factor 1A
MARGEKGELITKENCPESNENVTYGRVTKMLGGHNVLVLCSATNREHMCVIRGKMRNRGSMRISPDEIVLVALRDFEQKSTGDILIRYTHEEATKLKQLAEEVDTLMKAGTGVGGGNKKVQEDIVEFEAEFDFDAI